MIKAVFFDLDGTLIDTEKYYRICWPKALAHFGYNMTDEQELKIRSMGRPFVIDYFKKQFGEDCDYATIREYRKILMHDMIEKEGLNLKKGVVNCLKFLKTKNIKIMIVTASDRERTKGYLEKTGIIKYFDDIISATQVKRGKPAPDVYEYACKVANLKPEECLAIEDAPNGIESAYEAGLKVIMVPDQTEPTSVDRKRIVACIDSLDQLENKMNEKKDIKK